MTLDEILKEFDDKFSICSFVTLSQIKAFISERFKDVDKALRYFELAKRRVELKKKMIELFEKGDNESEEYAVAIRDGDLFTIELEMEDIINQEVGE